MWPCPCRCYQCVSVVLRSCRNVGSVTVTNWPNLESTSPCCQSLPSSAVEPNFSLRCRKLPFKADLLFVFCNSSNWGKSVLCIYLWWTVSGSGRWVWKAADGSSHPGLRERGKSWDGWREPKRRIHREDDSTYSSAHQRPKEIKERSGFTAVILRFSLCGENKTNFFLFNI